MKVKISWDETYPYILGDGGFRPREVEMLEEKHSWVVAVLEEYDQVMKYLGSLYRGVEEVEN